MKTADISGFYVAPGDLIIVPVKDLPTRLRCRIDANPGDCALTRPRTRKASKIVDRQTAELLELFRKPSRIVDAVIAYAQQTGNAPEAVLRSAYPVLDALISARFIVPKESVDAAKILASIANASRIDDWKVVRCITLLDESEIYQVRGAAGKLGALKILRQAAPPDAFRMLKRELRILAQLDSSICAPLIGDGIYEARPYLVTSWCDGEVISTAAAERRRLAVGAREGLLELCVSIASAYARLHSQDILHGDVHPHNILACNERGIKIIDYGLARLVGSDQRHSSSDRGGVASYFEPEYAGAILSRVKPPLTGFYGEQYSIAVLLYFLITGAEYIEFSYSREAMMNQIMTSSPLPFVHHGIRPWPEMERVLHRALSKDPLKRFSSVTELRDCLKSLKPGPSFRAGRASPVKMIAREILTALTPDGRLFESQRASPLVSLNLGVTGTAYALYRAAQIQDDPNLLAWADVWICQAAAYTSTQEAFYKPALDLSPDTVGRISPYHTVSGVSAVDALIAQAFGDLARLRSSVHAFLSAVQHVNSVNDLTLGRSGVLLGCVLLFEAIPHFEPELRKKLAIFADRILRQIWEEEKSEPTIFYNGIAHGWAGLIYASLRWHQASGAPIPEILLEQLEHLAARAEPIGSGARWSWKLSRREHTFLSGWCGGTAGLIHLWTLTRPVLGDRYFELAERAAIYTWEHPSSSGDLCCGLAGSAYGLLNFYKASGQKLWLNRGQILADKAISILRDSDAPITSLYRGQLAALLLGLDLTRPEWSCMPFFESEGWPMIEKPN